MTLKVKDIINELSKFDPETELVLTSYMEQGRGGSFSNGNNTDISIGTIDDQEEMNEVFYVNPDIDDSDDELPTFDKQIVHIQISCEETSYE